MSYVIQNYSNFNKNLILNVRLKNLILIKNSSFLYLLISFFFFYKKFIISFFFFYKKFIISFFLIKKKLINKNQNLLTYSFFFYKLNFFKKKNINFNFFIDILKYSYLNFFFIGFKFFFLLKKKKIILIFFFFLYKFSFFWINNYFKNFNFSLISLINLYYNFFFFYNNYFFKIHNI